MDLIKFIKCVVFITILSLTYIHLQMRIYKLAYQGKYNEKRIRKLIEQNSDLAYKILKSQSSSSLGTKLLVEESGLGFMDPNSIVEVSAVAEEGFYSKEQSKVQTIEKKNTLVSFLPQGAR